MFMFRELCAVSVVRVPCVPVSVVREVMAAVTLSSACDVGTPGV